MNSALFVSNSSKSDESFLELLKSFNFSQITKANSGSEARRILGQNDFDIVVINAPLSDEFGDELGIMITDISYSGVILLVKSEISDEVSHKVLDYGIFVVQKPVSRQLFYQAIKFTQASRQRIIELKNQNLKLQIKIDEIRLIDRAKCTLIQYLGMSEKDAHRYIEKQAMDMRQTKKEIALRILKTYET